LSDSDTSGKTGLSTTSLSNSSTSVTVSYNGLPLQTATISASASGVTTAKTKLKPLQMIYTINSVPDIEVFPSSANGDVAPTRTLTGNFHGAPVAVALDGECNLDVAEVGYIDVFPAHAHGAVSPTRSITTTAVNLDYETSIATDTDNDVWVAVSPYVLEFPAGSSGSTTPTTQLGGSNLGSSDGVVIGPTGKIYVATGSCCANNIAVFAKGSNGNAVPGQTVSAVSDAEMIALDSSNNMYLLDEGNGDVQVYAAAATGSATPIAEIKGATTTMYDPEGITVSYSNELFLANNSTPRSIITFLDGANRDPAPHTTISGASTLLDSGGGLISGMSL
ncbi:MAG TPA: hypothetical protein VEJ20_06165, partial [Candidatus Eremiobacteraceae bacterium]|nr:hypothetical protein [Candidatus Eremiobacteraceae bacterium]